MAGVIRPTDHHSLTQRSHSKNALYHLTDMVVIEGNDFNSMYPLCTITQKIVPWLTYRTATVSNHEHSSPFQHKPAVMRKPKSQHLVCQWQPPMPEQDVFTASSNPCSTKSHTQTIKIAMRDNKWLPDRRIWCVNQTEPKLTDDTPNTRLAKIFGVDTSRCCIQPIVAF